MVLLLDLRLFHHFISHVLKMHKRSKNVQRTSEYCRYCTYVDFLDLFLKAGLPNPCISKLFYKGILWVILKVFLFFKLFFAFACNTGWQLRYYLSFYFSSVFSDRLPKVSCKSYRLLQKTRATSTRLMSLDTLKKFT